ncbi:MAG: C2 family cysteine protease, partial [Mycoplasma sp.]
EENEKSKNFYDEYLEHHKDFEDAQQLSARRVDNIYKVEKKYDKLKDNEANKNKWKNKSNNRMNQNKEKVLQSENLQKKPINYKSNKPRAYYSRVSDFWYDDDDNDDFFNDDNLFHFNKQFITFTTEENNDEDNNENSKQPETNQTNKVFYIYKKYDNDPKEVKRTVTNWRSLSEKITVNQGINIIQTIGAVIKAIFSLQKSEDNFYDKSISLKEKIKLYQLLENNQRIVDFLSQPRPQWEIPSEEEIISEEEEEEEELIDENIDPKDWDLDEINQKIKTIQNALNGEISSKKEQSLKKMLEIFKKQKNARIEYESNKLKEEMIKNNKINLSEFVKKETDRRNKKIEEENKYISSFQKTAIDNIGKKKHERKVHGDSKCISILTAPSPKKVYKNQEMYKGSGEWTDKSFPPDITSLCPVDKNGNFILPEDGIPEDVDGWEDFKWCRAEEIFGSEDFQVFHEGIDEDDILQGSLGDCYFLSAIGALCKFPKWIQKLFYIKEKSEEHCYGVYLRINGIWELVWVDDYVPYTGRYSKRFAFSSANGNELWMVLLEKAWAKINGSFARVGCGGLPHEVFDVVTEAYSQKFDISPKFKDEIWVNLMKGQEKGFIMTAGTSGDTANLDIEEL